MLVHFATISWDTSCPFTKNSQQVNTLISLVFFVGGDKKCKKVSLLATTEDQITPLHDAVMNNRLDICKLLLQHGGLCSASVPIQLLVEGKAEGLKIH